MKNASLAISNDITTPNVIMRNSHAVTTSRNVAQVFNKDHSKVMRAIRNFDVPAEFNAANFGLVSYRDTGGRKQAMYELTRDGFTLLAMGFTGKAAVTFKIAYIEAFNNMEARLSCPRDDLKASESALEAKDTEIHRIKEKLLLVTDKLARIQERYIGQIEKPKPKRAATKKITDAEIRTIRRLAEQGLKNTQIAKETGRSQASISFMVRDIRIRQAASHQS